jgi:hypothetical protein
VTSAGQVRRSRLPVGTAAAWTGICAAAFAVLDRLGRGTTFFFDEWDLVLDENRWRMLLEPHNGHLIVVNRIFYRVLLEVVGLDTYRVARWCGLVVHLLVATLLVVVIRRRAGTVAGIAAGTSSGRSRSGSWAAWPPGSRPGSPSTPGPGGATWWERPAWG